MRPATSLLLVEHKELEVSVTPSQVEVTSLHPLIPLSSQAREGPHSGVLSPQRNMHEKCSLRVLCHSFHGVSASIAGSKGLHIVTTLVELPTIRLFANVLLLMFCEHMMP